MILLKSNLQLVLIIQTFTLLLKYVKKLQISTHEFLKKSVNSVAYITNIPFAKIKTA